MSSNIAIASSSLSNGVLTYTLAVQGGTPVESFDFLFTYNASEVQAGAGAITVTGASGWTVLANPQSGQLAIGGYSLTPLASGTLLTISITLASLADPDLALSYVGTFNDPAVSLPEIHVTLSNGVINMPAAGLPTITGSAVEDQVLTAVTTGISDGDGLGPFSYQWLRGGSEISGATSATYTLGDSDPGQQISVRVRYTDGHGNIETLASAPTAAVVNVNDAPVGVADTLSATEDVAVTWTAAQLLGNDTDADGNTLSLQSVTSGVGGSVLLNGNGSVSFTPADNFNGAASFTYIATDGNGGVSAATTVTVNVAMVNDAPTGGVTIAGTPTQGQTLTASNTLADVDVIPASGTGAIGYQWLADGLAIGGATGNTLVLGQAQVGKIITVKASYTDGGGTAENMISAPTTAVANVDDEATGTLGVTGVAQEGGSLSASLSGVVDADGSTTTAWQWQENLSGVWTALSGKTSATLAIPGDQSYVGKSVRVVATTTDVLGGTTEFTSSAQTIINVNDAPTGGVTIAGTPAQGQTLTAGNTLADADGIPASGTGVIGYQWLADGLAIGGATGNTLVLGQAQVGKIITVKASYTDGGGTAENMISAPTTAVVNVNDPPTLANPVADQQTTQGLAFSLTFNSNVFSDLDGDALVYTATLDNGNPLPVWLGFNAVTRTFSGTPGSADAGSIRVKLTASDGTTSASDTFALVVGNVNDAPTGTVTLTGTPTQGQILTAANTLADSDGMGAVSYQWLADGNTIGGATGNTLVLGQAQVGKAIAVRASYTDGGGTLERVTSTATAAVVNVNDAPTGGVTISGSATQGQTLTVANTLADADGIPSSGAGAVGYQWLADGNAIPGATASSFVLSPAQVGKSISVTARYIDNFGTAESKTSVGTPPVTSVDTQPPEVSSFSPADEATGVPVDSNIVVSFNEAIQRGVGSIVLKTADGSTVATYDVATSPDLSLSGTTLTLNPSVDLEYSTGYKLEFAAGTFKDLAGNVYAGTSSYNFTTSAMPDTTAPTLTLTDNLAGTALRSTASVLYTLNFSEDVTGLEASDFTVTNGTVATVTGSGSSWAVSIVPTLGVASGVIGLTLKADSVLDLAGNPNAVASNTSQALDTAAPVAPKLVTTAGFNSLVDPQVTFQTSLGSVVFELNPDQAPVTVANMLAYVNTGFYDGTLFHRVIPGFVVQGGGFNSGLAYKTPIYGPIVLESNNGLSNLRGTLAMARTPTADSATDQFFVNLVNNTGLNYASAASPGYAVFGKVVSGMEVVDAMALVPTATSGSLANVPVTEVTTTLARQTLAGIAVSNTGLFTFSGLEAGAQWAYSLDAGAHWSLGSGSSLTVPVGSYNPNTIRVAQRDVAGNVSLLDGAFTSALVVETTAPVVTTFSPADEAAGVAVGSDIVMTFSEVIQRGSGSLVLKTAAGAIVATYDAATSSNLNLSGNTLTINPTANLAQGTGYKLELAAGAIKDLAGNAYAGTTAYNFTTIAGLVSSQTLSGTAAQDVLMGAGGADTISGLASNDVLIGGAGNDRLDGGTGLDTAVYAGNRAEYTVSAITGGLSVTGPEGSDTLLGIERLHFAYSTLAFDIDGNAGQTYRLYQAAFNRTPDAVGLGGWVHGMDTGMSLEQVASGFIASAEFQSLYGVNPGNLQLVTLLYSNVLHRAPDQAGSDYWIYQLEHGMTREQALAGFSESAENKAALLPAMQNGISFIETYHFIGSAAADVLAGTGGDDTFSGLGGNDIVMGLGGNDSIDGGSGVDTVVYTGNRSTHTVTRTGAGLSVSDVSGTVDGTDALVNVERLQFADLNLAFDADGNAGEVYRLYQAAFNRTPDAAGLGDWIGGMDQGMTLLQVATGFIGSAEFQALYGVHPTDAQFVTLLYSNVLHRAPDPDGYAYWINQLGSATQTHEQVLTGFSESAENQAALIGVIQNGMAYIPV